MTDIHIIRDLLLWLRDRVRERWSKRPKIDDVRAEFRRIYPEADIIRIRIWEDVRTARSYQVRYRRPGSLVEKDMTIEFMPEAERWAVRPPLPAQLP